MGTAYIWQGGELIEVIDPDGNITCFAYNGQGRVTSKTDPLGNTTTSTYNGQGLLASTTNPDGSSIVYGYDSAGHKISEIWYAANGTVTEDNTYTYNAQGQMLTASNDEGTYTFTYNDAGELIGVTEPFGVWLAFGYDAAGHRTSVVDSFGGETDSVYNTQGELISESYRQDGQVLMRIDQSYNSAGAVEEQTRYSDDGVTVVAITDFTYNAAGEVTDILSQRVDGTTISDFAYGYNAAGQLISETDNGTVVGTYTYDQSGSPSSNGSGVIGQLIGDGTNTYTYDAAGNRIMPGYVVGTGNELLSDGTYDYTYDAEGNEATRTNIATGDQWTYGYDVGGELVSAVEKDAQGNVEVAAEYKYDAFGNRIEQDVRQAGATTVQRYALDGWNPAKATPVGNENFDVWADLNGDDSLATRYVRGDVVDQLFGRVDSTGVNWTLTDRLGSVRDVISNSGNVEDAITYDAFGNITSETNSAERGRYAWSGRELDVETGLQYNRARYYDSSIGRWISQDPMGFAAGDSNLYRYVNNAPTEATDPSGMDGVPTARQLLGGGPATRLDLMRSVEQTITTLQARRADETNPAIIQQLDAQIFAHQQMRSRLIEGGSGALLTPRQAGDLIDPIDLLATIFSGPLSFINSAPRAVVSSTAARTGATVRNVTPSVPGGGLAAHEALGGHTIAEHVGRTQSQLIARLTAQPGPRVASTFTDLATAEGAIGENLATNASSITTWLAGNEQRLVVTANLGRNVGFGIPRAASGAASVGGGINLRSVLTVLVRDPRSATRIVTSYPIPSP